MRFWLTAWSDGIDKDARSRVRSLRYATNNSQQIKELGLERFGLDEDPVDILVGEAQKRHLSCTHRIHLWSGTIAPGSFIEIGKDVLMSSPEFMFLQMASHLGMRELVKLGYELCATYRVDPYDVRGFCKVVPRTTVAKLKDYLDKMPGSKGIQAARVALQAVLDNAASPAEVALAMLICMPKRFGGYGLPKPLMNARIDLDEQARAATGKQYLVCDLFWPEYNIAVEYDSDMFHVGSEKISDDSVRRNALISMGITVITVTRRQLYSVKGTHAVAEQLAKAMGKRRFSVVEGNMEMMRLRELVLEPRNSSSVMTDSLSNTPDPLDGLADTLNPLDGLADTLNPLDNPSDMFEP